MFKVISKVTLGNNPARFENFTGMSDGVKKARDARPWAELSRVDMHYSSTV